MPKTKKNSPKKKREYVYLPNGCYRTEIKVTPENWKSSNADMKREWIIWYRYYDPNHSPYKQPVKIRGMNKFHDRSQRQIETQILLDQEHRLVDVDYYNHVTSQYMEVASVSEEDTINNTLACAEGSTPLNDALQWAFDNGKISDESRPDIKSKLKQFKLAATALKLDKMPVISVRRKHVKIIFDKIGKDKEQTTIIYKNGKQKKGEWTASLYNHFIGNMGVLFAILEEYEACDHNPVRGIKRWTEIKKQKKLLASSEKKTITKALAKNRYYFLRWLLIYFHSGTRRTEMMRMQESHVSLRQGSFTALIKKGKVHREVDKPIKDIALHLWAEVMAECSPGDYLFGRGLRPGPKPIRPEQVSRRWKTHVKDKLKIKADMGSLRHQNFTEIMNLLSKEMEQIKQAEKAVLESSGHTSPRMLNKVYDQEAEKRKNDLIKKVGNNF